MAFLPEQLKDNLLIRVELTVRCIDINTEPHQTNSLFCPKKSRLPVTGIFLSQLLRLLLLFVLHSK